MGLSVIKRGDRGWYVDVVIEYPDGTKERRKKKSPLNTKRDALAFESDYRRQLIQEWHDARRGEVPTLAGFSDEFFGIIEGETIKISTLESYRTIMHVHLVPHFGHLTLDTITARDVEAFKAKHRKSKSPKTIRNYLAVLSKVYTVARRLDIVRDAPLIEMPKAERPDFSFWTFEEADRVLAQLHTEPLIEAWVRLALATGLRCGELSGLQWGDIDLTARQMHVKRQVYRLRVTTPKGNRMRTVPLSDAAVKALEIQKPRTFLRAMGTDEDWVFWERDDESPGRTPHGWLTDDRVKRGFGRVITKAGVPRIRQHDLRHTFASHCIMRGVPVEVLREWLGHVDIQMTMRYAHLAPRHTHQFVELLNRESQGTHTEPRNEKPRKP